MNSISDIPVSSLVAGDWQEGNSKFTVLNKYTLEPLVSFKGADEALATQAVTSCRQAFTDGLPDAHARAELLFKVRDCVARKSDLFVETMCAEAGFPMRDARNELARALETLALCAEEAKRLGGESVPFSGAPGGAGRIGFTVRVPLGVVVAITPFNAPLNTVCHKIGPALAAGNAVILKPSEKTPLTANLLAMCFMEAGVPEGALSIVQGGVDIAQALLADRRVAYYAFTGSTAAGQSIQSAAGIRRTQMELGSISSTIVLDDADLDQAVEKCVGASFRKAGQVCTSIQVLLIQNNIKNEFTRLFLQATKNLVAGDPAAGTTDVGPMISLEAAMRVEAMLKDQPVVLGGQRSKALLSPTVVEQPLGDSVLLNEEVFGPVVCLLVIDSVNDAIDYINKGDYGLATGLFTSNLNAALSTALSLDVGSIHINETSSSRVDLMPYGGVKASGFGLEGPRYAIREMSHARLITVSGLGPVGVM